MNNKRKIAELWVDFGGPGPDRTIFEARHHRCDLVGTGSTPSEAIEDLQRKAKEAFGLKPKFEELP